MKKSMLVATMLAALTIPAGTAFAKGVKAPVQKENGRCGENLTSQPVIGKAIFSRSGNMVTVKVSLKGAEPNQTYHVYLYENSPHPCTYYTPELFTIVTNKKGNGHGVGSMAVDPEATEFFVDPYNGKFANDTPTVTLP